MEDFILSDVFIQSNITTSPSSINICDVTLPEVIVSRASWQRWENCGTSCVAQQELTRERGNSKPLLGAQSPLQTDGTTEETSFVPNVFASLMDANICSMSCFSQRASTQEDLTSGFHVIVKQIWCDKKKREQIRRISVNWSVQNEAGQSLFSSTKDVLNRMYSCHFFYKYSLTY